MKVHTKIDTQWYRILVGILLASVIFGIAQPLIWRAVFKESPPESAVTVAILLTIVLAILGLGGFGLYRDVRIRLSEEINNKTKDERRVAHEEFQKARRDALQALEEQENLLMSKLHTRCSFIIGEQYDDDFLDFLRKKGNAHRPFENRHLETAIEDDERALSFANKLPWDKNEYKRQIILSKNNLAYDLACRGVQNDKKRARELITDICDEADRPGHADLRVWVKDTYALVWWRFAEDKIEENESLRVVKELLADPTITPDYRKREERKYTVLLEAY